MHHALAGSTTVDFRQHGFSLLVALDENYAANGELYLDDGISFSSSKSWITLVAYFKKSTNELTVEATGQFGYSPPLKDEITVFDIVVMGAKDADKAARKHAEVVLDRDKTFSVMV